MRASARLLLAVGCVACTSSPPAIRASDYDQTCTQSSDCIVIDEGNTCCTGCGNAAINKKDEPRYRAAAKMRSDACKGTPCPAFDCAQAFAVCTGGSCTVCRQPSCEPDADTDAASDAPSGTKKRVSSISSLGLEGTVRRRRGIRPPRHIESRANAARAEHRQTKPSSCSVHSVNRSIRSTREYYWVLGESPRPFFSAAGTPRPP